jgi:hypothetical protein
VLIPQSHGLIGATSEYLCGSLLQDAGLGSLHAYVKAGRGILPCYAPVFAHYVYGFLKCADLFLAVELVVGDILAGALLPALSERPA